MTGVNCSVTGDALGDIWLQSFFYFVLPISCPTRDPRRTS